MSFLQYQNISEPSGAALGFGIFMPQRESVSTPPKVVGACSPLCPLIVVHLCLNLFLADMCAVYIATP